MKAVINEITWSILWGKARSVTQIAVISKLKITRGELLGWILQLHADWSSVTWLSWKNKQWTKANTIHTCNRMDIPIIDKEAIISLHKLLGRSHPEHSNLLCLTRNRRWQRERQKTYFKQDRKHLEFVFKKERKTERIAGKLGTSSLLPLLSTSNCFIFLLLCSPQHKNLAHMPMQRK